MELNIADFTFIEVGVLGRTKGVKGFIYCHLEDSFLDIEEDLKYIFLFDGGNPYPLKITDRQWSNGFLVKFTEKYTMEKLRTLSDSKVYVNKKDLAPELLEDAHKHEYSDIIGYTFTDINSKISGTIDDIIEYPHQLMVVSHIDGRDLLFPIHDAYIDRIETEPDHIYFDLPEGLFDLND